MKIYQKFLLRNYFKNFLVLFLALELFFTGIDLMQNFKSLPDSANLQVMYAIYKFLGFIQYTLPLSLVFAMTNTIFGLIKSSELVSLYALGLSKKDIIKPILYLSILITLLYIFMGFSSAVKANDRADNIKKYGTPSITTKNLFIKSKNRYIAIGELFPSEKRAEDFKVFVTKNYQLQEVIKAKEARFYDEYWLLKDITKTTKIYDENQKEMHLKIDHLKSYKALKDFNPQMLSNIFKGEGQLTIQNSIKTISLMRQEGISSDKLRARLYSLIIFPIFAPIVIFGLFFPIPLQRRGSNIALLSSSYIFMTLLLWGIIFTMSKISQNGALSPEMGILLPIVLLLVLALYISNKKEYQ